jgi:murein DD-endopeptidase MepM/ murein hydrolase activator NlpD
VRPAAILGLATVLVIASFAEPAARSGSATTAPPATYRVKAGDTLTGVAARHHVTVAALVTSNKMSGTNARLRVGQSLVIPAPGGPAARERKAPPAAVARRSPGPPPTLVLALPDFSELAPLFAWPVEGQISSAFGRRRMGWHRGIDIKAELGTIVTAAAGGTVVTSGYQTRYGRVVKIEHANGFMTVYAHNDDNRVEAGERVTTGQAIAAVGRTGRATAHHLHFEIRQAGLAYNPLYLLPLPPRTMLIEEAAEEDHDDDE